MEDITVYSKPDCEPCKNTKNLMAKYDIKYNEVDITQDDEARDRVVALGYMQSPVVVAGDTHWSGFRFDRIKALRDQIQSEHLARTA